MQDLLVPLYNLASPQSSDMPGGLVIRKVFAAEVPRVLPIIEQHFSAGWASEFQRAAFLPTVSAFVAVRAREPDDAVGIDGFVGFAVYDAAAKGVFGPTGVMPEARGSGLGKALLLATLHDMRAAGYAYAIIGGAGPGKFYQRTVGAQPIAGSDPGFLSPLVKTAKS